MSCIEFALTQTESRPVASACSVQADDGQMVSPSLCQLWAIWRAQCMAEAIVYSTHIDRSRCRKVRVQLYEVRKIERHLHHALR